VPVSIRRLMEHYPLWGKLSTKCISDRGRWKCGSGKCRSWICGSREQGYCDRRIEQIMLLC